MGFESDRPRLPGYFSAVNTPGEVYNCFDDKICPGTMFFFFFFFRNHSVGQKLVSADVGSVSQEGSCKLRFKLAYRLEEPVFAVVTDLML